MDYRQYIIYFKEKLRNIETFSITFDYIRIYCILLEKVHFLGVRFPIKTDEVY